MKAAWYNCGYSAYLIDEDRRVIGTVSRCGDGIWRCDCDQLMPRDNGTMYLGIEFAKREVERVVGLDGHAGLITKKEDVAGYLIGTSLDA